MIKTLIGKRVQTIPHNELSDDYFGLTGTIIRYETEQHLTRDGDDNIIKLKLEEKSWIVRFDEASRKIAHTRQGHNLCATLRLHEGMFEVLGDSGDKDVNPNEIHIIEQKSYRG
jgi:hypothetical protein